MIHIPTPAEFAAFLAAHNSVDAKTLTAATLRDISRLVEIDHLLDEGFLSDDIVLGGGMAMRLRGSSRLTMKDADLSAKPKQKLTQDEILDVLEVQDEAITIVPGKVTEKTALFEIYPLTFTFDKPPAAIDDSERRFKVDLAIRGLELPAQWVSLSHSYPFSLGFENRQVPIIALLEHVAEKSVGYGIFKDPRHFSDLAFFADRFPGELAAEADVVSSIAKKKFEGNRQRLGERLLRGHRVTDYESMKHAYTDDYFLRPLKALWASKLDYVGGIGGAYTFNQALALVQERVVPVLFPE